MKSKSIAGTRFRIRACMAVMAMVGAVVPMFAQLPAVLQVPTSNRVAGSTVSGYNKDSGSALNTELSSPSYNVFDSSGNQYISDTGNNCVRKVDATTGNISVVAGYEATPTSPDTCNAAGLKITHVEGLMAPTGLALDADGDLYIADSGHNCVRELLANTTGSNKLKPVVDTCTHANPLKSYSPSPTALFADGAGDLVVSIADKADNINQVIFHGTGDPDTTVCDVAGAYSAMVGNACSFFPAAPNYVLNSPAAVALDQGGNFYLADTGNSCVRKLTSATLQVSSVLGQCASDGTGTPIPNTPSFSPTGLVIGQQGYLYVANASQGTILQTNDDGTNPIIIAGIPGSTTPYSTAQNGIAAVDATLIDPTGLSLDALGNVNAVDTGHGVVLQLAYDNQFPAVALPNSSSLQTLWVEINSAVNLTSTQSTDFPISTGLNTTCNGPQTPSATTTPNTCKVTLAFKPSFPGERRSPVTLTDSSTTPATEYQFGLSGLGEGANALFIPGTIATLETGLSNPLATVVDAAGDTFFSEAGANPGSGDIQVLRAGQTTPTMLVPAGGLIQTPSGLAVDSAQNLYVADSTANAIFKVDVNANVTTVATGLSDPVALVVDTEGNIYVAQDGSGAADILKIYAGGQQVVVAGLGTNTAPNGVAATTASFVKPSGLYMDANDVLYVSDESAYRVYDIDTTGTIHFFAGNGTQTDTNPTVPTGVGLQGPSGLIGDAAGDIYIADGPGNRIFVVLGGQNPGIQQIVGTGTAGDTGDGGAANIAEVNNPVSVALDGNDNLYLVDAGNDALRIVDYQDPTLNFGYVMAGTTAGPMETTLWDSGNLNLAPLTNFPPAGTQPSGNTAFTQVSNGCGGSLLPGATCSLSYDFTPPVTTNQPPNGLYEATATSNATAVDAPEVITLIGITPTPTFTTPNVTATYSVAYTLTASITTSTPGAPAPTGTMTFAIGGQTLCLDVAVGANGQATCTPSPTLENVVGSPYTVTVSYSGDSLYPAATSPLTLTILPAPVTITANNFTRPYNTPNPTFTGTIIPQYPFPAGQSITDTYTTTATQTSAPGTYPITPANPATAGPGTLLSNYAITYVNGTLTITQNSGGVSINSPAVTAVYGSSYTITSTFTSANTPAPTGTATFTIGGQPICPTATLVSGAASCSPSPTLENVGGYTVTVTYSGDAYYPQNTSTTSLTITPLPVTITAGNASRPYNTPNPTFTGTITPNSPYLIPAGQSISDTYSTTATQTSAPGTYPITPANPATAGPGTLLSNYSFTYVAGTLTITQATGGVTITSPAVTAVYGNTYTLMATLTSQAAAPTGSVSFTIGGQVLCPSAPVPAGGVVTCSPSPTLENVGSYPVTVNYSGDTNYGPETSTIALTITPAPVTITAANASRPYDTPNPAFTGTVTGVVAGQSITDTYSTTAVLLSPAGTYPITPVNPATAGPGTLLANYSITYVPGTLTITQATGAVTISAPSVTAVYGTSYILSATLTSSATTPTGTVTFSIGGQAVCPAATISAAGVASCSPSPILENVGSYPVTVTYSGNTDYPSSATSTTLTITPAPVTITANSASRPYDTSNPAFTGSVTGVVAGQSITETFTTTAVLLSAPGTYPIVPAPVAGTGTLLTNYSITPVNGTLTITQATGAVTISSPAVTAVYGTAYTLNATLSAGTTPTGTVSFSIGGQLACPAATVSATGTASCSPSPTLENAAATPYTVAVAYSGNALYPASGTSTTLTITPAPVTITATNTTRPYNTPNPTFSGTVSPANPFPAGQSITETFTTQATQASQPGTYPIVPAAVAGSGTLLSNYSITPVNGILTITSVATGPTGSFTISATPPEQEIDLNGTVNYPVTLTSVQGFTDTVSFSCSGLPAGASCAFAPGTVTPTSGGTSTTVMTIGATVNNENVPPGSFGYLRSMPGSPAPGGSSFVLAWTMMPFGFGGSAATVLLGRRRKRDGKKMRWMLWLVPVFLLLAGLSGCGAPNNYKIYTVTVTATDNTFAVPVSQSTTVELVLAR